MFEASFKTLLEADTDLVSLLTTFESEPAIFSGMAPQKAEPIYVVFDIEEVSDENLAVNQFTVTCDIYDFKESGVNMREAAERIKYVCDRIEIKTDARYDTIRLFWESGREVENTDINIRHYVVTIYARAGRKKWAEETIP